jgi:hypothetical protein
MAITTITNDQNKNVKKYKFIFSTVMVRKLYSNEIFIKAKTHKKANTRSTYRIIGALPPNFVTPIEPTKIE